MTQQLSEIPLLFTFNQIVMGDGFIAGVQMSGRALLEEQDDEIWISGVSPVGVAGGGLDRSGAFANFRKAWAEVLFDIAAEACSFPEFEQACSEFLSASQDSISAQWQSALELVRKNKYVDPTLPSEVADEKQVKFEVHELEPCSTGTDDNQVEAGLLSAA